MGSNVPQAWYSAGKGSFCMGRIVSGRHSEHFFPDLQAHISFGQPVPTLQGIRHGCGRQNTNDPGYLLVNRYECTPDQVSVHGPQGSEAISPESLTLPVHHNRSWNLAPAVECGRLRPNGQPPLTSTEVKPGVRLQKGRRIWKGLFSE